MYINYYICTVMANKLQNAEWYGFDKSDSAIAQYLLMKQENFTIKDIGISYTELNYWDKKELLPIVRESDNGWRKFNFFDIVWLGIIRELRAFGISTALIREFKESVFSLIELSTLKQQAQQFLDSIEPVDQHLLAKEIERMMNLIHTQEVKEDDVISFFEYWLLGSIVRHEPVSLLFFLSGEVAYWNNASELKNDLELRQKRVWNPHTVISLNTIMCDLIEENLIVSYLPYLSVMNAQEAELLSMINQGKYDSITITFKDHRPDLVLGKKALPPEKRKISEVLLEGDYQDIHLVQHRGKVVSISNERKILFADLGKNL